MNNLRAVCFSRNNIGMLIHLCINRIYHNTGYKLEEEDPLFIDNFKMVLETVISQELSSGRYSSVPVKTAVLKLNSIVIVETSKYISSIIEEQMRVNLEEPLDEDNMKTNISDIESEVSVEQEDYIESERDIINMKPMVKEKKIEELTPEYEEEVYVIKSNNKLMEFSKETNEYSYDLYIDKLLQLEVLSIEIDKSDYMITEYSNTFHINDQKIEIKIGNYTDIQLAEQIQKTIDSCINSKSINNMSLMLEFEKTEDCYIFYFRKVLKKESLTQSLKNTSEQSISIDMSCDNSIANVLGFEERVYILKTNESIKGHKHSLGYTREVNFNIKLTNDIEDTFRIPLNVDYNSTKYFEPQLKKIYKTKQRGLFEVNNVTIKLKNEYDKPYNIRNKIFVFTFKVKRMTN